MPKSSGLAKKHVRLLKLPRERHLDGFLPLHVPSRNLPGRLIAVTHEKNALIANDGAARVDGKPAPQAPVAKNTLGDQRAR